MMLKEKKFQTHRGFHTEGAMENTMAAFVEAKRRGSEMIEFDVRLTRDYVPVIYHDETLLRLHKVRMKVGELTLREMRSFAPNTATLDDVLCSPDVPEYFNVELKTDSATNPSLEIQVVEAIRKRRSEERIVFSSFNPFSLIRAHVLAPEIARALLVTQEDEKKNYWFLKQMSFLPLTNSQYLHWDQDMTSKDLVNEYKDKGYKIACFTVNDVARARELMDWGVESIISDTLLAV